jgi:hypothetical protein
MIELKENEDINTSSSCIGVILRPQFRSQRRIIRKQPLCRIIEDFFSRRLVTFFFYATWYSTILLAFLLLKILSG